MTLRKYEIEQTLEHGSKDEIRSFIVSDVLFRSFEEDSIEYHTRERVDYDNSLVTPSLFTDNLWYFFDLKSNKIKVGSSYDSVASVLCEDRVIPKPITDRERTDVTVTYRCDVNIRDDGIDPAAEVIVSESL